MSTLLDPAHPVWSLLRLVILMGTMTLVLWLNASNFDITEIRSLITVFLVAAGLEGGSQTLHRFGKLVSKAAQSAVTPAPTPEED